MDTVLGVSMAPATVRMVLVEGENADGVTVDEENIELPADDESAPSTGADQVISAILGTREGATEAGYQLRSIGVTWTDPVQANALRDMLVARKVENVMLVSSFLAAAALAQTVGSATDHGHTALLYVEPDSATLAVVNTADGSIADVHRQQLPDDDDEAVAKLVEMVSGANNLEAQPESLFVIGAGVDIPMIKPALEAASPLPVSAPEEPATALARGAALASASAPLFASSTAALAYAQDPGTGAVTPYAVAPGYLAAAEVPVDEALAYSAVPDEEAEAFTLAADEHATPYAVPVAEEETYTTGMFPDFGAEAAEQPSRRPFLAAMSVLTIFVVGVVALVLSLAVSIRPNVAQRPTLGQNVVAPVQQLPAPPPPKAAVPAPPAPAPAPAPAAAPAPAPAPAPAAAPAPAPVPAPAAAPAPAPVPAPVRIPAPAPEAPAPAPPPPALPPVVPVIPQIVPPPVVIGPPVGPRGGDEGGWGHGGFGIPGLGGGHGGFGGGHGRGH
ncbi:MAG TPA: hypothetical protein VFA16_03320 [Mycobacterium sp.]|uniref:DUF7159 family protein n=1 Tax=Mycobacterium sp. TaxID=1785 RepID=UPI002D2FD860|nr:hypothetical protein [Mycobacterium sp.]HZU46279.1 hypothetical protein [Mycobacterium sp.]